MSMVISSCGSSFAGATGSVFVPLGLDAVAFAFAQAGGGFVDVLDGELEAPGGHLAVNGVEKGLRQGAQTGLVLAFDFGGEFKALSFDVEFVHG